MHTESMGVTMDQIVEEEEGRVSAPYDAISAEMQL